MKKKRRKLDDERNACGVGFVAERSGSPSARVLPIALAALARLEHRGAVHSDGRSGDGAGVLTAIPEALLRGALELPDGDFAVAMLFLPPGSLPDRGYEGWVHATLAECGLEVVATRDVPVNLDALGPSARASCPDIVQLVVPRPAGVTEADFVSLVRRARIELEGEARERSLVGFHVASFSPRTLTYKALTRSEDLPAFYLDLQQPDYRTSFALFHRRFSTNTSPSWSLTQPFRMSAHNGEFNTIAGNRAWMRARTGESSAPDASDSATFDEALVALGLEGYQPAEAMSLLMPPAWENDPELPKPVREFFAWRMASMEPWDGPACVVFTDGEVVGAALDRSGLRPARHLTTDDGLVVVASEAGVVDHVCDPIGTRGRLGPGDIFVVDLARGRVLGRSEVRAGLAGRAPYGEWLERDRIEPSAAPTPRPEPPSVGRLRALGVTREEVSLVLGPMLVAGTPGVGSMGDDAPLAILSSRPRLLSDYFRQRFAQVTNPPIDPLRESFVMSLRSWLGPRPTLSDLDAPRVGVDLASPVLTPEGIEGLLAERRGGFRARALDLTFARSRGHAGFEGALEDLLASASRAVDDGASLLVLDDRALDADRASLPALLAVSAVHQHLVSTGRRTRASLVVATGEARDDHQIATLLAFGAEAVCPVLAFELLRSASPHLGRVEVDAEAERRYVGALEKGLRKILSKMGIATIRSYIGSQLFEILGLSDAVVDAFFPGTPTLVGGLTLADVADETLARHDAGFAADAERLDRGGAYRFRRDSVPHAYAPDVVKALQASTAAGDRDSHQAYARLVHERPPIALRDLLDVRKSSSPLPLEDVESLETLQRRFMTAAMSLGALSPEAHETLAEGMRRLSGRSNSGEGGELGARNAIKQVASARFGVTTDYLVDAEELQIKIAQGSKPGEGGQLPGHKTVAHIARVRRAPEGTTLISPPPHHDIYSIEDLAQLIHDLRQVNPTATIGVKLVTQAGIGTVAAGVVKAGADAILIGGHDGGTGASSLASIKHVGGPWELGLAEVQRALIDNGLRSRVRLQVEGGLKTGRDVVLAALLGADEFGFGTAPLVALGCVMARQCHLDTCPAGIATQRESLRAKFTGTPDDVVRFFTSVAGEVRELLSELGVRTLDEIVGGVERLSMRRGTRRQAVADRPLEGPGSARGRTPSVRRANERRGGAVAFRPGAPRRARRQPGGGVRLDRAAQHGPRRRSPPRGRAREAWVDGGLRDKARLPRYGRAELRSLRDRRNAAVADR